MIYTKLREAIAVFNREIFQTDLVVYLYEFDKKTVIYRMIDERRIDTDMSQIARSISIAEDYQDPSESDVDSVRANIAPDYLINITNLIDTGATATSTTNIAIGASIVFNIYSRATNAPRLFKVKLAYKPSLGTAAELYNKLLIFSAELKEIYLGICIERSRLVHYIEGCHDKLRSKVVINDYLIGILESSFESAAATLSNVIPDNNSLFNDAILNIGEINKMLYMIGDILKITKTPYVFLNHTKNLTVSKIRDSISRFLIDNIVAIEPRFDSRSIKFYCDRPDSALVDAAEYLIDIPEYLSNNSEYLIDMSNILHSLYYLLYTYLIIYHRHKLVASINEIRIHLQSNNIIKVRILFRDMTYDGYKCDEDDFIKFVASIKSTVAEPNILYALIDYLTGTITATVSDVSLSYPVINLQNESESESANNLKSVSEYYKLKNADSPPIDSTRKRASVLVLGFNKPADSIFTNRLNSENFSCKYIPITDLKDYWRVVNTVKRRHNKYRPRVLKPTYIANAINGGVAGDSDDGFIKKYSANTTEAVNRLLGKLSNKMGRRGASKLKKSHKLSPTSSKSENDKSANDLSVLDNFDIKATSGASPQSKHNTPNRVIDSPIIPHLLPTSLTRRVLDPANMSGGESTNSSPNMKPRVHRESVTYSSGSINYDDIIGEDTDYISTSDETSDQIGSGSGGGGSEDVIRSALFGRNRNKRAADINTTVSAQTSTTTPPQARKHRAFSKKYNISLSAFIKRSKVKYFVIIIVGDSNDTNKAQFITELISAAHNRFGNSEVKFMYIDTRRNLEQIRALSKIKLLPATIAPTYDMINEFNDIRRYLLLEYNKISKPLGLKRVLIVHQNSITSTHLYLLLTNKGFANVTVFNHNMAADESRFEAAILAHNVFYIDYHIYYFRRLLSLINDQEVYKIIVIANASSITYDKKIELYNSGVSRVLNEPIRYEDILPAVTE